jgi:peptide/nickel transport system permease protein
MSVTLSEVRQVHQVKRRYFQYFGWCVTALFVIVAICAPFLWTVDPVNMNPANRLQSLSASAWLGTDAFGRDVYSRVVYGLRTSLTVAAGVVAVSLFVGTMLGLLAGYVKKLDSVIMRIMDGLMAIPGLILAIALVSIGNAGITTVITAIAIPEIPRLARLVRSITLSVKTQPYIDAAILSANRLPKILFKHILPAAIGPLSVAASYAACHAIMIEAILSFLGAGLPSEVPSIGNTIAEGRRFLQIHPELTLIPGAILTLIILGINAVGESLRQRFDPRASWFK